MTQYINKDALVSKIDNILDYADEHWDTDYVIGAQRFADKLQDAIDTFGVKKVDLEKEIEEHVVGMPMSEFTHESEVDDFWNWARKEFRYFFELGLKTQKGE